MVEMFSFVDIGGVNMRNTKWLLEIKGVLRDHHSHDDSA